MWRLVALLMLLVGSTVAVSSAEIRRHLLPMEAGAVHLDRCSTTRDVENVHPPKAVVNFRADDGSSLTLTVRDPRYIARVHRGTQAMTRAIPVDVEATMPSDVLDRAFCSDLNGDGVPDFVVVLWLHGNGLGAAFHERLVVLSAQGGYRFWLLPTMWPSPEDFVSVGPAGTIVVVTTSFAQGNESPDAPGPYYVHDLWQFRGGTIVSANDLVAGFPEWISTSGRRGNGTGAHLDPALKQTMRRSNGGPREAVAPNTVAPNS